MLRDATAPTMPHMGSLLLRVIALFCRSGLPRPHCARRGRGGAFIRCDPLGGSAGGCR